MNALKEFYDWIWTLKSKVVILKVVNIFFDKILLESSRYSEYNVKLWLSILKFIEKI